MSTMTLDEVVEFNTAEELAEETEPVPAEVLSDSFTVALAAELTVEPFHPAVNDGECSTADFEDEI